MITPKTLAESRSLEAEISRSIAEAEDNILESVLANTPDYAPARKTTPATVTLEEVGVKLAEIPVPAKPAWVTQEQRDQIASLRAKATRMGAKPAEIAAEKCQPTQEAATAYIERLTQAMREWRAGTGTSQLKAATPKPVKRTAGQKAGRFAVTPTQWVAIRNYRSLLRGIGTQEARDLASRDIANDRDIAGAYIAQMRKVVDESTPKASSAPKEKTVKGPCPRCGQYHGKYVRE